MKELPYGPVNVELFQKIKAQILAEPTSFYMGEWVRSTRRTKCGTTGCIAGWALLIAEGAFPGGKWLEVIKAAERAARLLNLPPEHAFAFAGSQIFYATRWPEPYRTRFIDTAGLPDEQAKVAADYIDYICGIDGTKPAPTGEPPIPIMIDVPAYTKSPVQCRCPTVSPEVTADSLAG